MLNNLLSNDKLNISVMRESQALITNTLETPIHSRHQYARDTTTLETPIQKRHQYKRQIHHHLEEKVPL